MEKPAIPRAGYILKFKSLTKCQNNTSAVPRVSQKRYTAVNRQKIPTAVFRHFPQMVGNFKSFFTHLLHVPIYARFQIFIQLFPALMKLCHTKRDHHRIFFYISLELSFYVCLLSKWRHCWRHVISRMFVDIIKAADLGWLAIDNDQQSYQRLSQTSERARFGRCWTFWAYCVNYVVALNMA